MELGELDQRLLRFARAKYADEQAAVSGVHKMPGHAGFSYGFTVSSGGQEERWFLRMPPPNVKWRGTADVLRQVAVLQALDGTEVPHCSVKWFGDDLEWFGCPYFVVPALEGDVVRVGPGEWGAELSPDTRRGMARQAMTALAGIHRVDPAQVAYLGGPVPFAEDVKRWDRFYQRAADPERLALVPRLRERLLTSLPENAPTGVFHGDFQWSNLFYSFEGTLLAVIDWELTGIGATLNDVGWIATFSDPPAWSEGRLVSGVMPAAEELVEMYQEAWGVYSRGSNNGVNDEVLASIVDLVVQEEAEFVVFPGDLVNGSSDAATLASQLEHWRDIMAPIYLANMYGAKIYAGPGNHEIRSSESEEVWQDIFPELPTNGPDGEIQMTYSFDYLNAHFVMLNTNRAGNAHTVNHDWLVDDLAGTSADHIFVFGHEPAYPAGPHVGSSLDVYPDQRDAFWQLLADHDAGIYFAGHEHLYNHTQVDGVHQVIAGTCGAPIYSGFGGEFYHYALVTVDGLDVSVEVFDDNWEMRDSFGYTESECGDGTDNDGDGHIDFPDDPGCRNGDSNFEYAACQDGRDNDGDGKIDFDGGLSVFGPGDPRITGADPHCVNSYRNRESPISRSGCGMGVELAMLFPPLIWLHRRGSRRA